MVLREKIQAQFRIKLWVRSVQYELQDSESGGLDQVVSDEVETHLNDV